jgi:predicted RNA-binding protein YlxR (DUF448 family)
MDKKIPLRQCLGCREMKPKKDLIRIVRLPDNGGIALDFKGKVNGRGAYVCPKAECLKRIRKSGAASRQLKVPVPVEVWDGLEAQINNAQQ